MCANCFILFFAPVCTSLQVPISSPISILYVMWNYKVETKRDGELFSFPLLSHGHSQNGQKRARTYTNMFWLVHSKEKWLKVPRQFSDPYYLWDCLILLTFLTLQAPRESHCPQQALCGYFWYRFFRHLGRYMKYKVLQ